MSHIPQNPKKLLARVRRIGGQVKALEQTLEAGADCVDVLTQIAAARGAMHGLMLEVLSDHLKAHIADELEHAARSDEVEVITRLLRTYFK
ncbi:MAG TPA: metal/formaldehyde-sensitive transcriptional repressor [Stenotrophomonas sp.]